MPIKLTTPKVYSPGHGQPDQKLDCVFLTECRIRPRDSVVTLTLSYGTATREGECALSGEPHTFVMRDKPETQGVGMNPATGRHEVQILAAALTDFTDMRRALVVDRSAVGRAHYDVLSDAIYQWLIDEGHYEGKVT